MTVVRSNWKRPYSGIPLHKSKHSLAKLTYLIQVISESWLSRLLTLRPLHNLKLISQEEKVIFYVINFLQQICIHLVADTKQIVFWSKSKLKYSAPNILFNCPSWNTLKTIRSNDHNYKNWLFVFTSHIPWALGAS